MAEPVTTRRAEIGRERRARMRDRLIQAAASVMANHGSDNATIDTFIRAAGVARGTFYNHFKTREALLDAVWTSILALSADETTLNEDLRGYPRPDLRAGAAIGRFRYESETSATDLVVGTMRAALRAVLHEGREANYAEALCKMMLQALGVNRIEASRISVLPLPNVPKQMHEKAHLRAKISGGVR